MLRRFAHPASCIALAVEETITTPGPAFGYGRMADVAAFVTFALGVFA